MQPLDRTSRVRSRKALRGDGALAGGGEAGDHRFEGRFEATELVGARIDGAWLQIAARDRPRPRFQARHRRKKDLQTPTDEPGGQRRCKRQKYQPAEHAPIGFPLLGRRRGDRFCDVVLKACELLRGVVLAATEVDHEPVDPLAGPFEGGEFPVVVGKQARSLLEAIAEAVHRFIRGGVVPGKREGF